MAQATVTTDAAVGPLVSNAHANQGEAAEYSTRTFVINDRARTAVVYFEKTAAAANATTAFQWNFAWGTFSAELEPGESLYARVATGSVVLDTLELGR